MRDIAVPETKGPGFPPGPFCVVARILRFARHEASATAMSHPATRHDRRAIG